MLRDRRKWFVKGLRDGIPIMLGYFAVSIALGIAAKNAGMTAAQVKKRYLFQKITMPCTIALIFLYILVMPEIGFTISTFCFLTLQITLLSTDLSPKSWLKSLIIALIASLGIYVIFGCAFGLAVPKVSFIDLGLSDLYRAIFG